MTPLLRKLADHSDPGVAVPAQIHLARYYGILHPRADPTRIRKWKTCERTPPRST
jgi:hypothetical protein